MAVVSAGGSDPDILKRLRDGGAPRKSAGGRWPSRGNAGITRDRVRRKAPPAARDAA